MLNITLNEEKNGIELRFTSKPSTDILSKIKEAGFRWSNKQKMWYSKQNEKTLSVVKELESVEEITTEELKNLNIELKQENNIIDLWNLTRIDDIEDHYAKYHITSTKEIAAQIRKHLKKRFFMCKWSIRCKGYNEISIEMLESPFAIDSEIIKAITHYAYVFQESFNYDKSDTMTDYFNVNFYSTYEADVVSKYNYNQREASESEKIVEQEFNKKLEDFKIKEKIREEREFQEYLKQQELDRIENEKLEAERKAHHEIIESNAIIEDTDFYVDCDGVGSSKNDCIEDYFKDGYRHYRRTCNVTRKINFTKEVYEMFTHQLIDDYSFLEGMGGSETMDNRINDMQDYYNMALDERETVEWISVNCVAIYCDNILKIVIDPQGYGYARYVYFVDEQSKITGTYETKQVLSDEQLNEYKNLASEIESASADIITIEGWNETWNTEHADEYKQLMKKWIYDNNFNLSVELVRAISNKPFKEMMYVLLSDMKSIQEQFARAGLKENQRFTIVRMSEFGGIETTHGYFKSYSNTTYAQYKDAVRLIYRPEGKRADRQAYIYNNVLILNDWVELPNSLFCNYEYTEDGLIAIRSRYGMFDLSQYKVVLNYLKDNGIKPLVNTF